MAHGGAKRSIWLELGCRAWYMRVQGTGANLMEPPPAVGELVSGKQLRLVPRHAVEDVEERVLLELGEVAGL